MSQRSFLSFSFDRRINESCITNCEEHFIDKKNNCVSLPSLGLSLGSVLGGMADAGGPYCDDGLIMGRGSYLFSTGLTFSADSTLQQADTKKTVNQTLKGVQRVCLQDSSVLAGGAALPVVRVGQLSWFGKVVEAVDARAGLAHGLAVEATAVKVGQLLPVVLLILIWVIVVGTHHVIQGFISVGLLWLRGPEEEERQVKQLQRLQQQGRQRGLA